MSMAAHERPSPTAERSDSLPNSAGAQRDSPGEGPRPGLFRRWSGRRLSSQFGSPGLRLHLAAPNRGPGLDDAARRELLIHGTEGTATILSVRGARTSEEDDGPDSGHEYWVRIQLEGKHAYETRVRQRVSPPDQEWMQPGDIIACRVDPGDHDRVVLYVPAVNETARTNIAKILSDGRRAQATVLATTPVAADYTGRDDPVLRLDLELHAWDEPAPWRVRIVHPVPLSALELVDLGRRLEVAFFTVDRGESVAVDWKASRER
ncbi:hypothetical protein [Nocardia sp. NPDC006630]|uniref:hypothetical protein n=1 Tax=Nocardia sp. NPDC006630 TaxID=3157181 RepID=UPI0033AA47BE